MIAPVPYYILEFGDELVYLSPFTLTLFLFALFSRPERQVDIAFGADAYATKEISLSEMRFRRFMAIACGLASMAAVVTGDLFNFTLCLPGRDLQPRDRGGGARPLSLDS